MSERELLHSIVIAAPIDAVWARAHAARRPPAGDDGHRPRHTLEPGAPLYYKSDDGTRVFIVGRVIDVDPPRHLSHTQRVTTATTRSRSSRGSSRRSRAARA